MGLQRTICRAMGLFYPEIRLILSLSHLVLLVYEYIKVHGVKHGNHDYPIDEGLRQFRALDGISLTIPGGMFGLLGPNGAGKTTLLRILTTLLAPSSGQARVGGVDVMQNPGEVRQRLGYLPQDFGFYRSLTAFEMLDYIGALKTSPPAGGRIR